MKKSSTSQASSSLLGALLFISLLGTVTLTSFDAFAGLYAAFKTQWLNFTDSLSLLQPHRAVFPN